MQTQGNTILITGGGSGIGRGLAEAFHKLGNKVVIAGRSPGKLKETTAANPGMESITFDVDDPADIRRFAKAAVERFPTLDVLVNNAGIMRVEDLTDQDPADAEAMVTTNLLGPIRLTAALMAHFLKRPRATVINVTSALAFVPLPASPTYCATKAAMHSYSLSLREQLKETRVEVIELAPPYVQTHLTGEHQASDPRAIPLDQYIAETMKMLLRQPDRKEVIIEQAAPLRYAEAQGTFDEVFARLSAMSREFSAGSSR